MRLPILSPAKLVRVAVAVWLFALFAGLAAGVSPPADGAVALGSVQAK